VNACPQAIKKQAATNFDQGENADEMSSRYHPTITTCASQDTLHRIELRYSGTPESHSVHRPTSKVAAFSDRIPLWDDFNRKRQKAVIVVHFPATAG
jgi:hypothetical protein